MNPFFEYYEYTINDLDLIVSYHIEKDTLFVRKWDGITNSNISKLPKLIETTGFEEFCIEEGLLDINGMEFSPELETYVEANYTITMYDFIQNREWMQDAIEKFIIQNHEDKLV